MQLFQHNKQLQMASQLVRRREQRPAFISSHAGEVNDRLCIQYHHIGHIAKVAYASTSSLPLTP